MDAPPLTSPAPRHAARPRGLAAALACAGLLFPAAALCAAAPSHAPPPTTAPVQAAGPRASGQPCDQTLPTRALDPLCRGALAAERSARFAQWTAVAGSVQLIALVVQIFALIFTLRESNRGSRAATTAAAAASRQAELAERATATQLRATATQLRAYVLIDAGAVRWREDEAVTTVHLTVKNYGQTPAFRAKAWVHSWVEAFPLSVALPEPPEDLPMSDQVMGPGFRSTYNHRHSGRIEGFGFQEIESGRAALYVYGAITYHDAFDKPHVTRYLLFCRGPGALAAGVLGAYPEGNEAD